MIFKMRNQFRLHRLCVWLIVLAAGTTWADQSLNSDRLYDFESGIGAEWSTQSTTLIGSNRVLGLFNDVNGKFLKGTHLNLKDLPPGAQVNVSFDLFLIGTWDSGGKLADRFTVTTQDGKVLLELKEFPNAFVEDKDTQPVGNRGKVYVESRERAYWVVPLQVTMPSAQANGKEVSLEFRGHLTGRKTEFWAIDNVKVRLDTGR